MCSLRHCSRVSILVPPLTITISKTKTRTLLEIQTHLQQVISHNTTNGDREAEVHHIKETTIKVVPKEEEETAEGIRTILL